MGLVELLSVAGWDVSGYVPSNDVVSGRVESELVKLWQDKVSIVSLLGETERFLRSDVKLGVKIESMADVAKSPLNYSSPDVARMALADVFCWTGLLDNAFYRRVCSDLADFYFSPSVSDVECASDLCGPSFQVFLMRVAGLEPPAGFVEARQRYFTPEHSGYVLADAVESDLVRLWQDRAVMCVGRSAIRSVVDSSVGLKSMDEAFVERYEFFSSRLHFGEGVKVLERVKSCLILLRGSELSALSAFYDKVFNELESFYNSDSD